MGKRGAKPMIVSEELKNEIVRDYRRGLCIPQLINIYGFARWRITKILKENDEVLKPGVRKGSGALMHDSVKEDYQDGIDVATLARKYKCSQVWIYKILHSDNLFTGHNVTYKTKRMINDIQRGDLSLSEIARRYGVSRQRVFKVKERMVRENEKVSD